MLSIKNKLYNLFVRRVPSICKVYESYVDHNKQQHNEHKWHSWILLLKLNITYHILKLSVNEEVNYSQSTPYIEDSESSLSCIKSPQKFADALLKYDVISFDIFDTLIFRPFSNPTDLFYMIGVENKYLDFSKIRAEMEALSRSEKTMQLGIHEINIDNIYSHIEKYTGLKHKTSVNLEFQTEFKLCFANPYMKKVFDILKNNNKNIIITSDMYLKKDMLCNILEHCGYSGYSNLFVSCDFLESKHSGKLYDKIKSIMGKSLSYVHIGDNIFADIQQAKKHEFDAIYYKNVNQTGMNYRCDDMSCIVGSAYRGIVNSKLHSGVEKYSMEYEYGYVYGGLFVLGYCNFIHEYVKTNNIDKVLFLSRDGDILKKIYDQLYPQNNSEYVYWSRLAGTKLSANHYKYDFFKRFITHKIDSGITVKSVFNSMELGHMFSRFCCKDKDILTKKLGEKLQVFLLDNWDEVLSSYLTQIQAGKIYYSKVLDGCCNVCAVDVGWAGSGAVSLSYLVNDVWNIKCKIIGLVAGTNTQNNTEPNASESLLQSRNLETYCYGQTFNRDLWKHHNPNLFHNVYFEMLLSSVEPSFKGFELINNSEYKLVFSDYEHENSASIHDIQRGIKDFVVDYTTHFAKFPYMMNISGSDAYAPFRFATLNNAIYLKKVLGQCTFEPFVGQTTDKERRISEQIGL